MFENRAGGSVIQTQDLFLMKEGDAASKIGNHMLIAAVYKKGIVAGNRYDSRQNEKRQWIKKISDSSLMLGFGLAGAFESFCHEADSLKLSITDSYLPERYVTLSAYDKFLSPLIKSQYEAGRPLPLDLMYADVFSAKLKVVRFNGDPFIYSGFGILGGYPYDEGGGEQISPADIQGNASFEEISEMVMRKAKNTKVIFPVKKAVAKMLSFLGEKDRFDALEQALDAVKSTLFECDPPSKKEMFEITIFEKGELTSAYMKRCEKKDFKIEITEGKSEKNQ